MKQQICQLVASVCIWALSLMNPRVGTPHSINLHLGLRCNGCTASAYHVVHSTALACFAGGLVPATRHKLDLQ